MSTQPADAEKGPGQLKREFLDGLSPDEENQDNVIFYKRGKERIYALTRIPNPGAGDGMPPSRIQQIYNRWLRLYGMNRYVAMKQFHGAIKESDECAYLVVDYFPGGSLNDTNVVNDLQGSHTEAMIVIVGILGQLAMLHKKGLVHRTLSPSRIVLDNNKYPHIVGWSRMGDLSTNDEVFTGYVPVDVRACFVPPEIIGLVAPASRKIDLWSFAMICLWLVDYGNQYFRSFGPNLASCRKHARDLPSQFEIPREFQDLLAECLNSEYEERPAAGRVLERILEDEIGLNNTNWERVRKYASANIRSEDGTETLESFYDAGEQEYEEEKEKREDGQEEEGGEEEEEEEEESILE